MRIDAETFLLGLLGYPLGHTLSPSLHNAALAAASLNGVYLALPTSPEALPDVVRTLRAWRVRGLNVTIPHKVAVIPLLDGLTAVAEGVGAVNTLFWQGDRLIGDNTDAAGFEVLSEGLVVLGRRVLVLGCGGSARAVGWALAQLGARAVVFAVRRSGSAYALCETLSRAFPVTRFTEVSYAALDAPLEAAELLVNTTPVGMARLGVDSPLTPLQVARLPDHAAVLDLVYGLAPTRLLVESRSRGLVARDGRAMLAAQAQASFERWTGVLVERSVWEEVLGLRPDPA